MTEPRDGHERVATAPTHAPEDAGAAPPRAPGGDEALPTAEVRRRSWLSVVWVVPLIAAVVAGYLAYGRLRESGPTITITFRDGSGVRAEHTEVRYRGVRVGEVRAIELSRDLERVDLRVQLLRSAAALAREGSVFWIVRPQVDLRSVRGLSTVITGPYIQAYPGAGKSRSTFTGVENPPTTLGMKGLRIVLTTPQLGSLQAGTPVSYRGLEVGTVTATDLARDATLVRLHVLIGEPYSKLVHRGSRFWMVSGLDVKFSLFRGLQIDVDSLRSLLTGGISFATPDEGPGTAAAANGTFFPLYDKPLKEWLEWTPRIRLPLETAERPAHRVLPAREVEPRAE